MLTNSSNVLLSLIQLDMIFGGLFTLLLDEMVSLEITNEEVVNSTFICTRSSSS